MPLLGRAGNGPFQSCRSTILVKYHSTRGTLQISTAEEFEIQCVEIFTDHGDPEILLAWLEESVHEGNYETLLPSEARNIGPHPTLS